MVHSAVSLAAIALMGVECTDVNSTTDPFWYGPDGHKRCPVGWDSGGHSDRENNKCCEFGRNGNTRNCHAPELYFPTWDNNPNVCCYWRTEINKYFYKPTRVVGYWKSLNALDPTHSTCVTIGSSTTQSQTQNFARQVTDSLSAGFGIELEGISASSSATHEVQQTWSRSSTWSRSQSEERETCENQDAIERYIGNGWIWQWQWAAHTTTMWGTSYETLFDQRAYTYSTNYPPRCAPGKYARGHYPDYQQCESGALIGSANHSMAETMENEPMTEMTFENEIMTDDIQV